MNERDLSADQREALQEITNIGMGRAGAALAKLLGTFVTLSVPEIQLVSVEDLRLRLTDVPGTLDDAPSVRQAFQSDISGEALVMFGPEGSHELRELMGYETDDAAEAEMLADVANLLVGACVCNVFEQLGRTLSFSRPTLLRANALLDTLARPEAVRWEFALLLTVRFSLENRRFTAHLVTLLAEAAIGPMKLALDHFLAQL